MKSRKGLCIIAAGKSYFNAELWTSGTDSVSIGLSNTIDSIMSGPHKYFWGTVFNYMQKLVSFYLSYFRKCDSGER